MNCIIIDDEELSRVILGEFAEKTEGLDLIDSFSSAIDAMKFLNKNDIDLIFLDIHMPTFSGFDFLQTVKQNAQVVMTTSDKEYALKAFEFDQIIDYLVKPISEERFNRAVQKAFTQEKKQPKAAQLNVDEQGGHSISTKEFFVNVDHRLIKIMMEDVNSIEAQGDYILIKTKQEAIKVHSTLKKILEKLPEDQFFQVHRSHIISLGKIVDIEDNSVVIEKEVIPISRSKKPELMRKLNLL